MSEFDINNTDSHLLITVSPVVPALAIAGQVANQAAANILFLDYRSRLSPHTRKRQDAELVLFASYLKDAGVIEDEQRLLLAAAMTSHPEAWRGISWGLVSGFVQWQLQQGYAIGSVNVRLATIKRYCGLATSAGAITPDALKLIQLVRGYASKEAPRIDRQRPQTRKSTKKAQALKLTLDQARALKKQPTTPQGARDALLMALLLDHGLRIGELAGLTVENLNLQAGELTFYRSKVHKTQTHRLTRDSLRAALVYLSHRTGLPMDRADLFCRTDREGQLLAKPISVRCLMYRVRHLGKQAGLAKLSPHDCRHYWASAARKAGTDIKALQEAGGWSSLAMPMRYIEDATVANEDVKLDL